MTIPCIIILFKLRLGIDRKILRAVAILHRTPNLSFDDDLVVAAKAEETVVHQLFVPGLDQFIIKI